MKKIAILILVFLFASWLYCTLFLQIDLEQEGYAQLILMPFGFLEDVSEKVKGVYEFFTEKPSWLKNIEEFFGDNSLFGKIKDFFNNLTGE